VSEQDLDALLSVIEQTELRSLTWGYVDGSLGLKDVVGLHTALEPPADADVDEAIRLLESRLLLLEVGWDADGPRYRSRFAETVRLLARLRQVFPHKRWDVAPDLVSDFRVSVAPRLVPSRLVSGSEAVAEWGACNGWTEQARAAAARYFGSSEVNLSRFQVEVGKACFGWEGRDTGLVVTAGTGAGKTLAYYLPVVIGVSELVEIGSFWTKSVSLYPRVELLKDQMSEVFRIVRDVGHGIGSRSIRLGALYDAVPYSAAYVTEEHWPRSGQDHMCPFLRCPRCGGELWWREADRSAAREVLNCGRCHLKVGEDGEIGLTRRSLRDHPPDLLFVSAEMVNQRLSDPGFRSLLGVNPSKNRRARFLLLDEIHTYGGVAGAQVAGVLRRYRHAVNRPMFVVGLSATLRDAPEFLAELTGLPSQYCQEISPRDEDLVALSASYQLVLKASSSNRTSVLATSIQSIFLLARMLDNERLPGEGSNGFYGSRLFVFLDTLDVTNRLFDDLRDAELGFSRSPSGPLAALRPPLQPGEDHRRDEAGQAWGAPERIHGPLSMPIRVSRTSSQDVGVDGLSDVVVATSSLEVGFNDPRVGAVVQHRGPRDLATFVQRRGRAGRSVDMRPWMVTVLSEYGQDRLAFQLYEQLFDPTLPARHLPTANRYVLRIQAAFTLLDWISSRLPASGSMWGLMAGPAGDKRAAERQEAVLELLDLLGSGDEKVRASLARHLAIALQVGDQEVDALLWSPPRSLLLEVVPTLRRRLATNWKTVAGGTDRNARWHPLPDFVPRTLFSDLLTPEVRLLIPGARADQQEWLPVAQALREFAPGRVSRRLAANTPAASHWVTPGPLLDVRSVMPAGEIAGLVDVDGAKLQCYRPWSISTDLVPAGISKTSFGAMDWRSSFEVADEGAILHLPAMAASGEPFESFAFHLHSRRNPLTVWRYAASAHATVVKRGGSEEAITSSFFDSDGSPIAVGFVQDVDAIRVTLRVPDTEAFERANGHPSASGWRSSFLRHRIQTDPSLSSDANKFELSWLADAIIVAFTRAALERERPGDPVADITADLWGAVRDAVNRMHGEGIGPGTDEPASGDEEDERTTKLVERLEELLGRRAFVARLTELTRGALGTTPEGFAAWARNQHIGAAGDVLLAACSALLPNRAGAETLVVDLVDDGDAASIWITETTLGGGGVIEAIAEAFASDPWRMVRAIEAAIVPSDLELLADSMTRTVRLLVSDADVRQAGGAVRVAASHAGRQAALRQLSKELVSRGIAVDQSLMVSLNQRVFRIGTGKDWDELLVEMDDARERVAGSTGLWPEFRLFALAIEASKPISGRLEPIVSSLRGQPADPSALRAAVLAGLWPAAPDVRPSGLETYNPFTPDRKSDPGWIRVFRSSDQQPVSLQAPSWDDEIRSALTSQGVALLEAPAIDGRALRNAIHGLIATPLDIGYLRVYPALAGIEGVGNSLVARLEVRELG
jgi:hypothetical protein